GPGSTLQFAQMPPISISAMSPRVLDVMLDQDQCGVLDLTVRASDVRGQPLGAGVGGATAAVGKTTEVTITLMPEPCVLPFADCNADAKDGCETDTGNDVSHCGGCGAACSTHNMVGVSCRNAMCDGMCLAGFADCDGDKGRNGCEVSLDTDTMHC